MPRIRKNEEEQRKQHKIWKVALYIRLSKEDANNEQRDESLSISNQRKILREYMEHQFSGEYTIVEEYKDDGITGTSDDMREDFQKMLQRIEAKEVDCVVTKTLSRMFRNYADQGYFLEEYFPLKNVRFIAVNETNIDTYIYPECTSGIEVPLYGLMNDRYPARISKDIRRTFDTKRKAGEFIGAFAPYGYKKDLENKNKLIVDEEAAEIVRSVYQWFVNDGMSKLGIVRKLNELGLPSPLKYKHNKGINHQVPSAKNQDGLWSMHTVFKMLKNQMYIGDMVQGKQRILSYKVHNRIDVDPNEWYIVKNTHEAIISKEMFDKAQKLHKKDTRVPRDQWILRPLSGFVKCADCGKNMVINKSGKNQSYHYYVCHTNRFKGKSFCSLHSIRTFIVEQSVLIAIQKQIDMVSSLSALVEKINQLPKIYKQEKRWEQLLVKHQKELIKLTNASDNLHLDWRAGDLSKNEYHRLKETYQLKIQEKEEAIQNVEKEIDLTKTGIHSDDSFFSSFEDYRNVKELNRQIVVDLIDIILIHENGEIEIHFNFADQYQRILEFVQENKKTASSF